MSVINFLKSKLFFKHLTIAIGSLIALFWIIFIYLDSYTLHNEIISVPDFTGIKINELDTFIQDKNLRYLIIDSVYDIKKPKGVVVKQDPDKNTSVKKDRTIYLYITAMLPPHVKMPKLQDKSLRQAIAMLETYGLKLDNKIIYLPDECVNCVLQQLIKGKKVEPGTMVDKGSKVSLVVGKGLSDEDVEIPDLIGLTRAEAIEKLAELSLNEGSAFFEETKDSLKARVYKQIPSHSASGKSVLKLGSSIDLFFNNKSDKLPLTTDTTARNVH